MTTTVEELQRMEAEAAERTNGEGGDGMSIEDMADQGIVPEEPDTEEYIEGATGQLSLSVGGRKPDSATFKMTGKEVKLAERTQFTKGSMVKLDVIASVDEITFRDRKDGAGEVTHTTRVHTAKPISVMRLEPKARLEAAVFDLADALEDDSEMESASVIADEISRIVREALDSREEVR